MIKAINKGYTLTVTSWENDGDNYNTNSITVSKEEKAKAYWNMMKLCTPKNRSEDVKLGNTYGYFSEKQEKLIVKFLKANPILLEGNDIENADMDQLVSWFMEISSELLGNSENYSCRVMESCVITYSPEDVYIEEIKF